MRAEELLPYGDAVGPSTLRQNGEHPSTQSASPIINEATLETVILVEAANRYPHPPSNLIAELEGSHPAPKNSATGQANPPLFANYSSEFVFPFHKDPLDLAGTVRSVWPTLYDEEHLRFIDLGWQSNISRDFHDMRALQDMPIYYSWPSGLPLSKYIPDPSKPCREPDCPLQNLKVAHNQGPYYHPDKPRILMHAPIFGISIPPPEIWSAYVRLTHNNGRGGSKRDMDLVIPFAFLHAGGLEDLGAANLENLYGDVSRNPYTEAFLDGLGLHQKEKKLSLFRCVAKGKLHASQ